MADFETTTDEEDCRVWAWAIVPIDPYASAGMVDMGTDIDGFMRYCAKGNANIYFHNLAFDGVFIIDWLLNNGYVWVEELQMNQRRTFTTLISNMGKFYTIKVQWASGYVTDFRDSLKKLNMPVSRIADSFKLPLEKLSIDYKQHRPKGWELTDDERRYIAADVVIVARALAQQFAQGMVKLTVGSDAMAEYTRLLGGSKMFKKTFPVLPQTMDDDVRAAYRGGWTYADSRWSGKVHYRPGKVFDVNSLYPSIMYHKALPYGEPVYTDDVPESSTEYPLFVTSITLTAKLKKNHLPCIQIKRNLSFAATEYQRNIDDPVTISCTNIDLVLWEDHYDLDIISYNGSWLFKASTGLFGEYIDKWYNIKNTSSGGLKEIAKLHLNSLYGKFATNPVVTSKYPILDENGVVQFKLGPEELRDPVYTPVGVFVTAYARDVTIRAAQGQYHRFAYADTDSLHLWGLEAPEGLNVNATELGAWKHEFDFDAAVYARAKAYAERHAEHCHCRPGEVETHIAGVPVDIAAQVGLNRFRDGEVFHGKLVPKRVPGGAVLRETQFTLTL